MPNAQRSSTISEVRERPILFSGAMVKAILSGRKTQTRRLVQLSEFQRSKTPGYDWQFRDKRMLWNDYRHGDFMDRKCPYQVGAMLWVRETWGLRSYSDVTDWLVTSVRGADDSILGHWTPEYAADFGQVQTNCHWRPSIHMPRWASRLTLRITDVRVERLQDISEDDARAEGVYAAMPMDGRANDNFTNDWCRWTRSVDPESRTASPRGAFAAIWHRINGKKAPWKDNPWVWVVGFERVDVAQGGAA